VAGRLSSAAVGGRRLRGRAQLLARARPLGGRRGLLALELRGAACAALGSGLAGH
jgi:hypothetical protein